MKTFGPKTVLCLAFGLTFSLICPAAQNSGKRRIPSTDRERETANCPLPKDGTEPGGDEPVAMVAGEPIYARDLASAIGGQMLQIRQQEYQVKSKALDQLIDKKLLEVEAGKQGITADQLQEKEVDSKVPEPTDAEIEGYYLAVRNQLNRPLDAVKAQLQKAVKLLKIQQAREEFAKSLRAEADVSILLRPPTVEVGYDPARLKGDPNAPVTIVEFSDFQCPFCRKAAATMNAILATYNGRVKLAFRDFPMRSLHPHAESAAEAARCAGEQGKFWEYHDALFSATQPKLDGGSLLATARNIGLDEKSFGSCLASGKFKAQVEQDVQDGTRAGISGTPGFFINGVFVNGAQAQAEFEKIIDAELDALKIQASGGRGGLLRK